MTSGNLSANFSALPGRSLGQADSVTHRAANPPVVAPYIAYNGLLARVAALVMLVPGLPLIAMLVVLVRLTSRGPGIYSQERVGLNGRRFTMYKIRTMRQDAESAEGATWCRPGDSRVTLLGRVLRALHMDELPQLWNVLQGEMALIGPRPERPEFTRLLEREIPGYSHRLYVLPGITGLAQINLPADTDLDSVRRKVILDCEYIETASLSLDLRIVARTLLRMCAIHGDGPSRLLGILRVVTLPENDAAPGAGSLPTPSTIGDPLRNTTARALAESLAVGNEE